MRRTEVARGEVRPQSAGSSAVEPPPFAVFTAVDGALLDDRFQAGASREAIRKLREAGVPVVPVTGMTLAEMEPIARDLGLGPLMIVEAGGAVARQNGGAWDLEPCGPPAEVLLDAIRQIEEISGAELIVYAADAEDAVVREQLPSGAMARIGGRRFFSEPFLIESGDPAQVRRAAARLGFTVQSDGMFYHLLRECDEGAAFVRAREELREPLVVAVGTSAVDISFVSRAEIPIIIPRADGIADADLMAGVESPRVASAAGPRGWASVIEEVAGSFDVGSR